MPSQILRERWCEANQSDQFSPDFWRAMAKLDKALADRGLKPIRIAHAERFATDDLVRFDLAIESAAGEAATPFWRWFISQNAKFLDSADRPHFERKSA